MSIRNRPDWMTRADFSILQALDDPDIVTILSPSVIANNLDYSQDHIVRRLQELEERRLVEKLAPGEYRISMRGRDYMAGNLHPSELE